MNHNINLFDRTDLNDEDVFKIIEIIVKFSSVLIYFKQI